MRVILNLNIDNILLLQQLYIFFDLILIID